MQDPINKVQSLVTGYATGLLTDLSQIDESARAEATVEVTERWVVLVAVVPAKQAPETQQTTTTECDKDCLALLAQLQRPLSAARLCKELDKRGIIWAEITVKRSLAKLRSWGLVSNSRRSPRGYFLPETLPIVLTTLKQDTKP